MNQRLLLLLSALLLSGCATIVGSPVQTVRIDSVPAGARFIVQDETGQTVAEGSTPQAVVLEKSTGRYFGKKRYLVMFERAGYVPVTLPLEGRANLWYQLGNLPLGGLPGWLLVDPFNGGMYHLQPDQMRPLLNPVGARG